MANDVSTAKWRPDFLYTELEEHRPGMCAQVHFVEYTDLLVIRHIYFSFPIVHLPVM